MWFHTSEAQRVEGENGLIPGYVGGYVCCSAQAWGLEWVWPARGWQSKELQDQGRLTMAWVHTEEWTERNQQILEATSREIRRCPRLWILAGEFNMEPETFGQYATNTNTHTNTQHTQLTKHTQHTQTNQPTNQPTKQPNNQTTKSLEPKWCPDRAKVVA